MAGAGGPDYSAPMKQRVCSQDQNSFEDALTPDSCGAHEVLLQ
jgi:hypothetical protein